MYNPVEARKPFMVTQFFSRCDVTVRRTRVCSTTSLHNLTLIAQEIMDFFSLSDIPEIMKKQNVIKGVKLG